jgi:hypothetical protein
MQKSFLLKLLLVAFFFAFFFCGCLAKVVLRQRVKKNYCSSNTKVKCICISIFRKNVLVIHFDNTKNRQLFIFTKTGTFHPAFFFFFLSIKQTGEQCCELEQKKGKTERQQAQFQQQNSFRKLRITQKLLFSFLERDVCSFSSCFFPILKGKRVIK